jgi:adenylate cyclase
LSQRIIDLADGDATIGNLVVGSPLALGLLFRGCAEMSLGIRGFEHHFDQALATARPVDLTCFTCAVLYRNDCIAHGTSLPDDTGLRASEDALILAEQSGDDFALACALLARGTILISHDGPDSDIGYQLLGKLRDMAVRHQFSLSGKQIADIHTGRRRARTADVDGAVEVTAVVIDSLRASGDKLWLGTATTVLVEALLQRGTDSDLRDAQAAIDRLAAVPVDPGFVMHEIPLLRMRALMARARGAEAGYRDYVERYRTRAAECGFTGTLPRPKPCKPRYLTSVR